MGIPYLFHHYALMLDRLGQSIAETCVSAYPRVPSSIPVLSHTFVEIDHEIISMAILVHSADSRRVVVNYKRKNVHKVQSQVQQCKRSWAPVALVPIFIRDVSSLASVRAPTSASIVELPSG